MILGRRGFTPGPSGSDGGIGIGGRPWLQKVATVGVAISLTIATTNTFRVAQTQYEIGYMDALALQNEVMNSMELKIIRVISDTFLWLAQAQTLIRLFPRQREKIIIKWTAFALITLNLLFTILNTFVYGSQRPYTIVEAIPAVSYLFHLALGLLYGAWVIYYGLTKRTYAFYHPNMRNICLVALMSITAVIVPVVFFVLDISKPDVAGWGDYVRWVGAAAASVVVWEWVERIEALERNDKKDGVLGREIFDGDEMLEVTPSSDVEFTHRHPRNGGNGRGDGSSTGAVSATWPGIYRHRPRAAESNDRNNVQANGNYNSRPPGRIPIQQLPTWPARPLPTATPVSRADSGSAESTVYAIRYHPIGESRLPIHETAPPQQASRRESFDIEAQPELQSSDTVASEKDLGSYYNTANHASLGGKQPRQWGTLQKLNPFRRPVQEPPPEVSRHTKRVQKVSRNDALCNRWDVLGRLEDFAAIQAERIRDRARPSHDCAPLPVTRIPAPPRRRTLREIIEEQDSQESTDTSPDLAEGAPENRNPTLGGDRASSPRLQGPFVSGALEPAAVTSRGNVLFASSSPRQRDRREEGVAEGMETVEFRSPGRTPLASQHQTCSSSQPRSPDLPRLPVTRISAPPRRTRSDG